MSVNKEGPLTLGRTILIGLLLVIVTLAVFLYPIFAQNKSLYQSLFRSAQEPLRVEKTNPQNGATNVRDDVTIEITFNNPLTTPTTEPTTTTTTEETITTTTTTEETPTTTTEPPTTEPPTTEAPTTEAPTTEAPTTEVPTTEVPTTETSPTATRFFKEGITLEPTAGALSISETDHTLLINPGEKLKPGTKYTLTIKANAVQDAFGDTLDKDFILTFTTRSAPPPPPAVVPPTVVCTIPRDGDTGIPIDQTILVAFSENIRPGRLHNSIILEDAAGNPVQVERRTSGSVLSINPVNNLGLNTLYTVRIPAGAVEDSDGNELRSPFTFDFRTQPQSPLLGSSMTDGL